VRTRFSITLITLILTLAIVAPAAADEVRLVNGDRLSGRTVSLAGGTLTFSTAYGNVQIPWASVTAITVDAPILITTGTAQPVEVTIVAAAAAGQATLVPGGTVALSDISALTRPTPDLIVNGGANAGFVTTAGNTDVNNLRLDGDVVARAGENRYTGNAAVTHAEDRSLETARNWTAGLKYDRFLTLRLFFNANTILTSDRFRDLDLRTALGVGIGYQLVASPRVSLTADAGFGYVNENLESLPDDSYGAARESTNLGIFLLPGRVQFFHQHDGYFGVSGDDNLFLKMQNGVRLGLAAGFVTTLRHDLDYDKSPAPGRRNVDRSLSLTLGYRF
jgi:putative salt-induced outer membrane protein YdiY